MEKEISTSVNVCLACDDNYAKYAGVTVASILANAKQDDLINVYILDGGVSEKSKAEILSLDKIHKCNISFITINNNDYKDFENIKTHSYISIPTFYRLKIASLFPNLNKIIYLDCDVIVNSAISELFNINIEDFAAAGVKDLNKKLVRQNPNYVNAGVMLINLDYWRKYNVESELLNFTKNNIDKISLGDQEIINCCLSDKIKIIDDEWNVQSSNFTNRSSYTHSPKIIHFVSGKKPWHWASFSYHKKLYYKYLQLTPWKLSDKEYLHWTRDNDIVSIILYLKYRPLFFLRPRFWKAVKATYFDK